MNLQMIETLNQYKSNGKKIIGCYPLYPPLELFHSLDLVPVVMWGLSSIINNVNESSQHIQNYVCSIGRHLVEFCLEHENLLDGIFSYNACDTLRNIPEIIDYNLQQKSKTIPWFHLHIPMVLNSQSSAVNYLKDNIQDLISELEKAFDVHFNEKKFKKSIQLFQERRDLMKDLENQVSAGNISFAELVNTGLKGYFLSVEDHIQELKTNFDQIKEKSSKKPVKNDTKKIIISGILPPYKEMINVIENSDLIIAGNDIAMLSRSYDNPGNAKNSSNGSVLDYYVDFYKNHLPCSTLLYTQDDRLNHILNLMDSTQSSGFVCIGEKFCEYEYFDYPHLEKHLKDKGYKTLFLEVAICDNPEMGSFLTRLESFIENL